MSLNTNFTNNEVAEVSKTSGRTKTPIYDPDPMDLQMRLLESFDSNNFTNNDLSNPQVAHLLNQTHMVSLTQLKIAQNEVISLRSISEQLREERENLRIQIATLESQSKISWLEIPFSVVTGFAINIITSDIKSVPGWGLLIVSAGILFYFRGEQVINAIRNIKKEYENVSNKNSR